MGSIGVTNVGLVVATTAVWLTATAGPSYATSFDCAKASSIVETLICRDPALSQLDDRLSAAYSAARTRSGNAPQVSAEQRAWMVQRNQCQTAACVSGAYSARIAALENGIQAGPTTSIQTTQADNAPATMCDTAAAFPYDSGRQAQGVGFNALNPSVAISQCVDAIARYPNSGRLHFQLGRALEKANRLAEAITAYRRASELGHGGGYNNLGELYRDGKGLPRDLVQAEQLFRQGAALKYPEAQFNLANMLLKAPTNAGNVEQARQLLSAAVAAGYVDAVRPLQVLGPQSAPAIGQPRLVEQQTVPPSFAEQVAAAERARAEARQRQMEEQQAAERRMADQQVAQQRVAEEARQRQLTDQQRVAEETRQRQLAEAVERDRQAAERQAAQQRASEAAHTRQLAEQQQRAAENTRQRDEALAMQQLEESRQRRLFEQQAIQQATQQRAAEEAYRRQQVEQQAAGQSTEANTKLNIAQASFDNKDYQAALRIWQPLADQGSSTAQGGMARLYAFGLGVIKSDSEALRFAQLAAQQGNAAGQNILGVLYLGGRGVPYSLSEAIKYLRLSADQGFAPAQYNLAGLYRNGTFNSTSADEGLRYYKLAADQGYPPAQLAYGLVLLNDRRSSNGLIDGVGYIRKAADQGNADAQTKIGELYLTGPDQIRNPTEGMRYLTLAASQGAPRAKDLLAAVERDRQAAERQAAQQRALAEAHTRQLAEQQAAQQRATDDARRQDEALARVQATAAYNNKEYSEPFRIWTELARRGDAEAQNNLGVMYDNGQGVAQDYNEALHWFKAAAEKGLIPAQINVGLHYANGQGVAEDYKEAEKWLRVPAEKGQPLAQFYLGALYLDGKGFVQDDKEAERWFKAASEQGNAKAKKGLEFLERKPLVKELLSGWPELSAASEYDVLVMLRTTDAPNIVKKLGGGVASTTGTAALCVNALYPGEKPGDTTKVVQLDQLVRSRLTEKLTLRDIQPIAQWQGSPCMVNQIPWDFLDVNKDGLPFMSSDGLRWLIANRLKMTTTVDFITDKDFRKFLTERHQAEEKRAAEQQEAEERKVAELAKHDAERLALRKANAKLIEQGDKTSWITSESRLFFIATGSSTSEVCYTASSPKVEDERRLVISGFSSDKSLVEREPVLSNVGQGIKLANIDEVFQHVQRNRCSIVIGTPNELKQLLTDGLPGIGRWNATVLSIMIDRADIDRLITLGAEVERRAAVERDKMSARIEKEMKERRACQASGDCLPDNWRSMSTGQQQLWQHQRQIDRVVGQQQKWCDDHPDIRVKLGHCP